MAKKKRSADLDEVELELTPMIDVVFNLLIFFMLTAKFKTTEGMIKSFLPKNRGMGSGTPSVDLSEVRIKCLWYGPDGSPINPNDNDTPGSVLVKIEDEVFNELGEIEGYGNNQDDCPTWGTLYARLCEFRDSYQGKGGEDDEGLPVIIDSRKQVPTRYVILVLNEVVRAELKNVTFAAPEREY